MPAKRTVTLEISPSQMVDGLEALIGELVEKKFQEFIQRAERTHVMATAPTDCTPQELSDRPTFWFDVEAARKFEFPTTSHHDYKKELYLTRLGTWIEHGIPTGMVLGREEYWKEIPASIALDRVKQEFDVQPSDLERFGALREV